jgi:hypothetical protein
VNSEEVGRKDEGAAVEDGRLVSFRETTCARKFRFQATECCDAIPWQSDNVAALVAQCVLAQAAIRRPCPRWTLWRLR